MKTYDDLKRALPVKPGQNVVIPKGTEIRTTHPKGNRISKRAQTIKVFDTSPGYCGRPPEIMWPGSGGYWCYVEMSAILGVKDA